MRVNYIGETKHFVEIEPSCTFELRWSVSNSGREMWEEGVKFVKVQRKKESFKYKPALIGGEDDVMVAALKPGEKQEIVLSLTTPDVAGKYKRQWMLVSGEGLRLGKKVSVKVLTGQENDRRVKRGRKEVEPEVKEDVQMDVDVQEEDREAKRPRRDGKAHKKDEPQMNLQEEWPNNTTHLFLDGNNMLFVCSSVRSMVLHRARGKAELVLEKLALAFLDKVYVPTSTLVYDNTRTYREHTIALKGDDGDDAKAEGRLTVCSASRTHKISDDAIVQWVSDLKHITTPKVVVTSDRELIERVQAEGGCVMKPGRWMRLAASKISGENIEKLDAWMDNWLPQQQIQ